MCASQKSVDLPELLIPAGSLSKLYTALAYGADAIYVGACGFSMRPDEASFTPEALAQAVEYTHARGKKLYVALNTLMFDEDLSLIEQWLEETSGLTFDALIVSDAGVFSLVQEQRPDLALHISTQMSTANSNSASFWKQAGADRVILARECTLEQATAIAHNSGIETEIFVHGAMCVAMSGRCLLSAHLCGKSGSRGDCKHTCRWEWQLVEKSRPGQSIPVFETDRETIFLGSSDLCLLEHIPELVQSDVASLKVEGRMKGEYYIAAVTRVYRAALDRYAHDPATYAMESAWMDELYAVSHRPYSTGFAFGYPGDNPQSLQANNRPVSTHETLGFVESRKDHTHIISAKNPFSAGDTVEWIGPAETGGTIEVAHMCNEAGSPIERSHCGTTIQVAFEENATLPQHALLRRPRKDVDHSAGRESL